LTPTLADIAKAARTSVSTVSRVVSGGSSAQRISLKTRQRVEQTAQRLGYSPNLLARSLRTRRTQTAALLVSDIPNPWFGRLASLIEHDLHHQGYSLMLCNSGEDEALEREYLQLLPRKGIDGLIVVPLVKQPAALKASLPAGLPVVVLDRPVSGFASVASDPVQTANILCDRLAEAGVKRVALVAGPTHIVTHQQRAEVISRRFEVVAAFEGPAQHATGHEAARRFRKARIDAVVCTNNFLGEGYLEAAGQGASCVGCFDEIAMMQLLPSPVACCFQDVPRLAAESVHLLLGQILQGVRAAGSSAPILIPSTLAANAAFERWAGAR